MPVKKILLFLISLLIIFSACPFAILSAGETQAASAIDISRPVKVGLYENEPKIFTNSDGKASGFWADIVNYIADNEGWQIEWVHGSWEECLSRLEAGEIDIMPDVTYTEERAQLYDFSSEVLLVSWSRIYAAEGVSIQSILDLEGKTIAVMKGSVNVEGPEGIEELVSAFNINCIYLELDNYTEVFEAVDNGQADAAVVNKDFGNSRADDYNIEMTGIIFQPSQIYFAFPKNGSLSAALIETIDKDLSLLKVDKKSVYYDALEKWLSVEAIEKAVIPVWVWWVAGIFLVLIVLLVAGAFILNLMVKQKTRQLRAEVDKQIRTEKKYTSLVEQSIDGIIVVQDGKIVFANREIMRMSGFNIDEIQGKSVVDFVSPRYKEMVSQNYAKRMAGEDVSGRYELEINRKDGRVVAVEINASVIEHEGRPADMAFVRDITERKKVEEQLAENQVRYRSLFENSSDAILLTVPDGRILAANSAACRMFGRTEEEICRIGRDGLLDLTDPRLAAALEEWRRTGEFRGELTFIRSDNSKFIGEVSSKIFYDRKGNPETTMIIRDVTRRREAEEKLRESEAKYRLLVENVPVGVIIIRSGKVLFANKQDEQITGYTLKELQSMNSFDIIYEEDRSKIIGYSDMRSRGEPAPNNYIVRIIRKDGTLRWLRRNVVRIDWMGEPASLVIDIDITERREAEDALNREKNYIKSILDTVPAMIVTLNTQGQIIGFNHYLEVQSGYSTAEVKGKDWLTNFVPEREHERVRETITKAITGVETIGFINPVLLKNGQERLVEWYSTVLKDEGGNITTLLAIGQDVTERMKAEEALKASEQRWQFALEGAGDGVWDWDAQTNRVFFSHRWKEMLGYTDDEIGDNLEEWDKRIHPDDKAATYADLQKHLDGQVPVYSNEHRMLCKNGSYKWILDRGKVIKWTDDNKPLRVIGTHTDISYRKQAEEIIRISEEKYRTLFETMLQGVIFWDKNGKLISANSATEKILGLTLSQIQGKNPAEVILRAIHEDGSPFPRDSYPSFMALKSGEPVKDVLMGIFNPHEDKYRWVVVNAMPQFKENEKEPYQVYTTFNDITQIKEIERALIQSESKLRQSLDSWETTFNSIKNAICLLALDDTIIRCNQAMNDMLGKDDKEIIGKNILKLIYGSEKHLKESPHFKMLRSGRREAGEISVGDKWYYVIVDPILDSEGRVIGAVHTMDDITERKTMEERMIMTDRLASIGELSSGIAHEVNNPLTGVIGIVQLLMARGDIPDDILKDLQLINDEAQRASKVARNLLVFARKHANEFQFSSVTQAIEKVLELRAYDQKNNNIVVIRDFEPHLPGIVMDYFQIQQVFLNIIINAEYAMKEAHNGGILTIRTEKVGEMVRISFTDDGPGISKENIKHIFDPFYTTKEVGKGTGLGLSICHGIISQHHGNIYAKSEYGKGATFVIELPINQPEEAEEEYDGKKQ
jgi:two-component system NtrC family sensor kinase